MKKFFAALLVALFGAVPLFADDVADVKAVIVKQWELAAKGEFAGKLKLLAPDYRETDPEGTTLDYGQIRILLLGSTEEHPEEFWLMLYMVKNDFQMPPEDQLTRMKELARTPKYVKLYKKTLPELVAMEKARAAAELKTLKFTSVKVKGNYASAAVWYDFTGQNGAIQPQTQLISLRRIDGEWRIFRLVVKNR